MYLIQIDCRCQFITNGTATVNSCAEDKKQSVDYKISENTVKIFGPLFGLVKSRLFYRNIQNAQKETAKDNSVTKPAVPNSITLNNNIKRNLR